MSEIDALRKELNEEKNRYNQKVTELNDLQAKHNKVLQENVQLWSAIASQLEIDKSQPLGKGSFGEVYYGTYYKAPVAIKTLKSAHLTDKGMKDFANEVKTLASIKHQHIVACYGYSLNSNDPFIILEYMEKGSLYHWIHKQSDVIPAMTIHKMLKEIALGMHYLHSQQPIIIHRDLKSLNILLDSDCHAKITDFGLAKTKEHTANTSTYAEIIGSIPWAAPEYLTVSKKKDRNERGDVYSFGVVVWELVTQEMPWKGEMREDIKELVLEGRRLEIPLTCSEELKSLMNQCWNERPSDRPEFSYLVDQLTTLIKQNLEAKSAPRTISKESKVLTEDKLTTDDQELVRVKQKLKKLMENQSETNDSVVASEPVTIEKTAEPTPSLLNEEKAKQLQQEGNTYYKNKKYKQAIKAYTEALQNTKEITHILLSNRSAAHIGAEKIPEAINDAKKCIELKPDWFRGYFRLGKAYLEEKNFTDAYVNFLYSNKLERSKETLEQIRQLESKIPVVGDRSVIIYYQANVIPYYLLDYTDTLYQITKINRAKLEKEIESTITRAHGAQIKEAENSFKVNPIPTVQLLAILYALKYKDADVTPFLIEDMLKRSKGDPKSQALYVFIKSAINNSDETELFKLAYEALLKDKSDLFVSTVFCYYVQSLTASIGTKIKRSTVLSALKIALENSSNKEYIIQIGYPIWETYLQDPQVQLLDGASPNTEFYKKFHQQAGSGILKEAIYNPFLIQALNSAVLGFSGLENLLCYYRYAILLFMSPDEYKNAEEFIMALCVQLYRCNYPWVVEQGTEKSLLKLKQELEVAIANKRFPENFAQKLACFLLFYPIETLENFLDLIPKLQTFKHFRKYLDISVLSGLKEAQIVQKLTKTTAILETTVEKHYAKCMFPLWESNSLLAISQTSLIAELQRRYPYYTFALPKSGKLKILDSCCGTGQETYNLYRAFKDLDITAIDIEPSNLSYAIRQFEELGAKGVSFLLADAFTLTTTHISAKFDIIYAKRLLDCTNKPPIEALKHLATLLNPGGLICASIRNDQYYYTVTKIREIISTEFQIFDDSWNIKKELKDYEMQEARQLIKTEMPDLAFSSLAEFKDFALHPILRTYNFDDVNQMVKMAGLKFVGFEFPDIMSKQELGYKGEYYFDYNMVDGKSLDAYNMKSVFSGFDIHFTCEKI